MTNQLSFTLEPGTLLLAGELHPYVNGFRVEQTAGILLGYNVPDFLSIQSAVFSITLAYAKPTKTNIGITAYSNLGFSEAFAFQSISGDSVGDMLNFDAKPYILYAQSHGAASIYFNFNGSTADNSDNGYVYIGDSATNGVPTLTVDGIIVTPEPSTIISASIAALVGIGALLRRRIA